MNHIINFGFDFLTEVLNLQATLVDTTLLAHGNCTLGLLLLTYDKHVGDVLHLVVADLTGNLLADFLMYILHHTS